MASEIQVHDNFLSEKELDNVKSIIFPCGNLNHFSWFFQQNKSKDDGLIQFTHVLYRDNTINSDFFDVINPLIEKLNVLSLIKVKINLQLRDSKLSESILHHDVTIKSQDQNTGIFYLNTNNGYTFFENGERVDSVENRIVIFPSSRLHAGTTHTDAPYRCVINLNWI